MYLSFFFLNHVVQDKYVFPNKLFLSFRSEVQPKEGKCRLPPPTALPGGEGARERKVLENKELREKSGVKEGSRAFSFSQLSFLAPYPSPSLWVVPSLCEVRWPHSLLFCVH